MNFSLQIEEQHASTLVPSPVVVLSKVTVIIYICMNVPLHWESICGSQLYTNPVSINCAIGNIALSF